MHDMIVMWRWILNRFAENSARMQAANQDISIVADIYASLIGFVEIIRDDFDEIEQQAKELTDIHNYTDNVKRVRRRNRQYDEGAYLARKCARRQASSANRLFLS